MNPRKIVVVAVILLCLGVWGVLYSGAVTGPRVDAGRIVAKALAGDNTGSYIAEVVTSTRYNGRTIRARATVYHSGKQERTEYGPKGRGVWSLTSEGKSYTCMPNRRTLMVSEAGGVLSDSDRTALLLRNYKPRASGTERVAGRNAYVIDLSPNQAARPSKRLWIDAKRYTVLRSIDYAADGRERGRMETQRIRHDAAIRPDRLKLPRGGPMALHTAYRPAALADLTKLLGFRVTKPRYLPAGYQLEGCYLFNCRCCCGHRSAQLTYTDGLNMISVFETSANAACGTGSCKMSGGSKACAMGGCEMARTGQMVRGSKTVVVVGDLLPDEIKRITESVD